MGFYDHAKMRALTIAAKSSDAYSADCFGPVLWVQAAQMLCDMGFTDEEVESLLRSKLTRWCRDSYGEPSTYIGMLGYNVMRLKRDGSISEYLCSEPA